MFVATIYRQEGSIEYYSLRDLLAALVRLNMDKLIDNEQYKQVRALCICRPYVHIIMSNIELEMTK